jgi:hypothetical protein
LPKTYIAISLAPVLKEIVENKMRLQSIIEAKAEPKAGDTYVDRQGQVTILVKTLKTKFGPKWQGPSFELNPRYGDPYFAGGWTFGTDFPNTGFKAKKLSAKDKKSLKQIFKNPEDIDRLEDEGYRISELERYIR